MAVMPEEPSGAAPAKARRGPIDIARVIAFFCSDYSCYVAGHTLSARGSR